MRWGSKVVFFHWDSASGYLNEGQTVSMLPDDFHGTTAAADLKVSMDGRFLYGSNRYAGKGENGDIVVFVIDQRTGFLKAIQHISSGRQVPRNFELDPSGRWMIVANHGSNNSVVFKIDKKTWMLTRQGVPVDVLYPVLAALCEDWKVSAN